MRHTWRGAALGGLGNWRSFEGPALFEKFAEEQQGNREDQDEDGNCSAEWPIECRAAEGLHDVGDHDAGRAADKKGREEVAEGQDERKSSSGGQAGHGEWKKHSQKCLRGERRDGRQSLDSRPGYVAEV